MKSVITEITGGVMGLIGGAIMMMRRVTEGEEHALAKEIASLFLSVLVGYTAGLGMGLNMTYRELIIIFAGAMAHSIIWFIQKFFPMILKKKTEDYLDVDLSDNKKNDDA